MKLPCVWATLTYLLLGCAVASKLRERVKEADAKKNATAKVELPSVSKWRVAFGNLAPYGPYENVPKAWEPLPNKTLYAETERQGFNNCRQSWEIAICYAYLTKRTYRIPALRQHFGLSVPFTQFAEWGLPSNIFAYYDERSFKMVIPSVPADAPLLANDTLAPKQNLIAQSPIGYTQSNIVFGSDDVNTRNFWQYAADKHLVPHDKYVRFIESALRVREDLLDRAARLLEENGLEPGKYVAIHRRRGDFDGGYNQGNMLNNTYLTGYLEPMVKGNPVLILTDTYDKDFEDKLVSIAHASRVVCWASKKRVGQDLAFAPQVDMLAAVPASKFIGTPVSTFSYGIIRWRVQAGTHKKGTPLSWISPELRVGADDTWNSPGAPETYLFRLEKDDAWQREVASDETSWFTESELFPS